MSSPSHTLPSPFSTSNPPPTLITQGAEALIYRTTFLTPQTPAVLKHRPSKPYRHPTLDKRLTRHRILSEARTLVKCRREGVSVPGVLGLDVESGDGKAGGWMMMEWVEGMTIKEVLQVGEARRKKRRKMVEEQSVNGSGEEVGEEVPREEQGWEGNVQGLMGKIGRAVGRLHEVGVVHGDLTTSNMMLRPVRGFRQVNGDTMINGDVAENDEYEDMDKHTKLKTADTILANGEIVLIDFGLAGQSLQDEDKAVDLYVLERAFGSTHPEAENGFQEVLKAYGDSYKGAKVVLKRLEDVRMRGRKRSMVG